MHARMLHSGCRNGSRSQRVHSAPTAAPPTTATSTAATPTAKPPTLRYVATSQAEIYAGPSEEFYPTAILKSGQAIEVHDETADGWLAITPPPGSFSWLPASQGLLMPGGRVVEVTEKSAVSWIGSALGTAKQYRWQVKLARGQQMAVLGEQTISDPGSGSKALWYKISPPAGEYRWIPAKATSDQPPNTAASADELVANSSGESAADEPSNNESQVVQASAQTPVSRPTSSRGPRTQTRPGATQPQGDRWADWHAMEFKNGSFSFPGLARMLGMQPTSTAASPYASQDPFDLTANTARGPGSPTVRSNSSASPAGTGGNSAGAGDRSIVETGAAPNESSMAVRQSRGWRDPRQLREERLRGSMGQSFPDESALASSDAFDARTDETTDAEVMDTGYEGAGEIGTSVITAGATEPRRQSSAARASASGSHDQSWYGIDQAPANQPRETTSLAQASLDDLQLELSTMVAGPEHTWNLAPLAERARYFIEHGQDSLQRGQARLLLERIESFAQIAQPSAVLPTSTARGPLRAIPASAAMPAGSSSLSATSPLVAAPATQSAPASGTDAKFDATGWLVPVHSSGRDMPTHALTNDAGRIIVYVSPAPGVNLTRFESQAIGVYGLRGYLPQLKTNHIQIQRIVRLH